MSYYVGQKANKMTKFLSQCNATLCVESLASIHFPIIISHYKALKGTFLESNLSYVIRSVSKSISQSISLSLFQSISQSVSQSLCTRLLGYWPCFFKILLDFAVSVDNHDPCKTAWTNKTATTTSTITVKKHEHKQQQEQRR